VAAGNRVLPENAAEDGHQDGKRGGKRGGKKHARTRKNPPERICGFLLFNQCQRTGTGKAT
jgi:hypothetical protein